MIEAETIDQKPNTAESAGADRVERAGRWGIYLSLACAVHCLALPALVVGAPVVGLTYLVGHGVELLLIGIMLAIAFACSCWGFRVHRRKRLFVAFAGAAGFMLLGEIIADDPMKTVLVMAGGLGLVTSHFLNAYLCRTCHRCRGH